MALQLFPSPILPPEALRQSPIKRPASIASVRAFAPIKPAMPEEDVVGAWKKSAHRLWVKRLRRTSSLSEVLQVLADFFAAINEDWLDHYMVEEGSFTVIEGIVACFPSMPQTSSALIARYLEKVNTENRHERTGPNLQINSLSSLMLAILWI